LEYSKLKNGVIAVISDSNACDGNIVNCNGELKEFSTEKFLKLPAGTQWCKKVIQVIKLV
jgi:hypothetical protein